MTKCDKDSNIIHQKDIIDENNKIPFNIPKHLENNNKAIEYYNNVKNFTREELFDLYYNSINSCDKELNKYKTKYKKVYKSYNKVREEHKICNVGKKDPSYYYTSNCGGICECGRFNDEPHKCYPWDSGSDSEDSEYYTDSSCDWMSDL